MAIQVSYIYNSESISDKTWEFIYGCAMHDAILQQSFTGDKEWVNKVKEPKEILRKYINKVLDGEFVSNDKETKEKHEELFLDTANKICKAINESPLRPASSIKSKAEIGVFSFGNAQKLINMTVKHVYTFTYGTPSLRENFRHCHCPMDSIMLSSVYRLYEQEYDRAQKHSVLTTNFNDAWGNEGWDEATKTQPTLTSFPGRYKKFQDAILAFIEKNGGDIFPIEFDFEVWKA